MSIATSVLYIQSLFLELFRFRKTLLLSSFVIYVYYRNGNIFSRFVVIHIFFLFFCLFYRRLIWLPGPYCANALHRPNRLLSNSCRRRRRLNLLVFRLRCRRSPVSKETPLQVHRSEYTVSIVRIIKRISKVYLKRIPEVST